MVSLEKDIRKDNREQRFIWMILNYYRWGHMPDCPKWQANAYSNRTSWQKIHGNTILRMMKDDGVISQSTDIFCVPSLTEMMEAIRNPNYEQWKKFLNEDVLNDLSYG